MKKPRSLWKTLGSKSVYENPYFKVREDQVARPNGTRGKYFVIETKPSVFTVALTPENEVYLIGIHRYTTKQYSTEVPGGSTDGQKPLQAAKRELWEETGLKARQWKKIGEFQVWNGPAEEIACVFLATGLTETGCNKMLDEGIAEVFVSVLTTRAPCWLAFKPACPPPCH
jgi:8-oxo-dGTP pyrophosphatase MutT (NUDIX family)